MAAARVLKLLAMTNPPPRPATTLALLLLTGAVALSGCTDRQPADATDSAPIPAATTTTTTTTVAADPGVATDLPEGFPTDVPVVAGTVNGKSFDVPGTTGQMWTLTVGDLAGPAFDKAQQLLTAAGFRIEKPAGPAAGCDQQAAFSKDRSAGDGGYIVALCSHESPRNSRLTYSVNVYPLSDWGTNLVTPSGMPAFPPAPNPPG